MRILIFFLLLSSYVAPVCASRVMKTTETCSSLNLAAKSAQVRSEGSTRELRFIASAIGCFGSATGSIPQSEHLTPIEDALLPLASRFGSPMPVSDLWGRPYYFRSQEGAYVLVSFGTDGLPDFDYDALKLDLESVRERIPPERNSSTTNDIVIASSFSVRWYE